MGSATNSRLRKEIAYEAAKLVAVDGLQDYLQAKKKAASKLGINDNRILPSNSEIEMALIEYQSLFQKQQQSDDLKKLRTIALKVMQLLEQYNACLVGPVLTGTANQYTEISLHLFCDTPELIGLFLENEGIPVTLCERRIQLSKNNPDYFPAFKFLAGDINIVAIVLPLLSRKTSPFDPVSGKPMKRGSIKDVANLINQ